MLYTDFEKTLESRLRTKADLYPHAAEYHRVRLEQTIHHLLRSILEQTDTLVKQSDAGWARTEEVISDILYCADMDVEQLLALEIPNELTADRDFEAVKTKLYETKYYPIGEHLNYISFPPALERKAFIEKHFSRFKEKSHFCDLGFGPGVLTAFILDQEASWRAAGVDISQDCLRHAERLLEKKEVLERSELSVADVRSLPYPDDTFDVVVAVEVLEHIPDPEAGLAEAIIGLRVHTLRVCSRKPLQLGMMSVRVHRNCRNRSRRVFKIRVLMSWTLARFQRICCISLSCITEQMAGL